MSAARGTETPGVDLGALSEAATDGPWTQDSGWSMTAPMPDGPVEIVRTEWRNDAAYIAALVNAHRRGELIPASAVEALADDYDDRNVWIGWDVPHTVDGYQPFNQRASADLRALVESARAGDAQ